MFFWFPKTERIMSKLLYIYRWILFNWKIHLLLLLFNLHFLNFLEIRFYIFMPSMAWATQIQSINIYSSDKGEAW